MNPNVFKTWKTSNNEVIKGIHPPPETLSIKISGSELTATPFKTKKKT